MKITLQQIRKHNPCSEGWKKLINSLPGYSMDTEVSIEYILENNGVKDAYWALQCLPLSAYSDLLSGVVNSVISIAEDDRLFEYSNLLRIYKSSGILGYEIDHYLESIVSIVREHSRLIKRHNAVAKKSAVECTFWAFITLLCNINVDTDKILFMVCRPFDIYKANALYVAWHACNALAWNDVKNWDSAIDKQWNVNEQLLRSWIERNK